MTNRVDGSEPKPRPQTALLTELHASRRAFVATAVACGSTLTGSVAASEPSEAEHVEYGEGGYGDAGYGGASSDADVDSAVAEYANEEGVIDTPGVLEAIADWRAGELDTDQLDEAVAYWRSREPVV